jgi:hypothetical protein
MGEGQTFLKCLATLTPKPYHLVLGSFFWEGPHPGALPYTKSLMTIVIPTMCGGIHTFPLVDIWTLISASFSHCMIGKINELIIPNLKCYSIPTNKIVFFK